jgi:glycogen operon protein
MLQAGDEFARTQLGNNNAYCQDNRISWIDWHLRSANADQLRFVQLLAQLRRRHVEFRRETFLKGATSRASVKDVTWLNASGIEMKQSEWHDENLRTLGIWFGRQNDLEGRLLLLVNAGESGQVFRLPLDSAEKPWIRLFDTASDSLEALSLWPAREYRLDASSVALLEC